LPGLQPCLSLVFQGSRWEWLPRLIRRRCPGQEVRGTGRLNGVPSVRACNKSEHIWEPRVAAKQHLARSGPPHLRT
jgi:hypothetical protein